MTIRELENLVGMTRANIRFYEQEGLLRPARLENGYRDYSEADAEALRKIKLLRQLHLDLNAIRALQKGEQELTQTLAKQLAALERDQAALLRVREVCRALGDSGASFATLDPRPWLEELEREPVPQSPRFHPLSDARVPDSMSYPGRRLFARLIDLELYSLIWYALRMLVFRWFQEGTIFESLLNTYVCCALMLLFEPLLIHFFATTPGKLIFGISIQDENGQKLTYPAALERTFGVFARGMGYGLPYYRWWRYWKSYKLCADEERCPWEREERYAFADTDGWRIGLCVLFFLAAIILSQIILEVTA